MLAGDPGQEKADNRWKGADQGQGVEAIDDVQGERFLRVQVQTEAARARRFIPLPEIYPFSPSRPAAGSVSLGTDRVTAPPRPSPPEPP